MKRSDRIGSFQEFWPYYVSEHSKSGCRVLHFIGSSAGLLSLTAAALSGFLLFIPLGLIIGYGFAWIGHLFIEKNKPATFKYPLWSLIADWKMWGLMITGRMNNEIERRSH